MGIEIKFYGNISEEYEEVPAKDAFGVKNWIAVASGTPFLFSDSLLYSFHLYKINHTMHQPKNQEEVNRIISSLEFPITTRDYSCYKHAVQLQHKFSLDNLLEEGKDKKWMEVGSGLGDFIPHLVRHQASDKMPRPIIIDPLDYSLLTETLIYFMESQIPSHAKDYALELLMRSDILRDSHFVEQIPLKLEHLDNQTKTQLHGQFFAVMDYGGAALYGKDFQESTYRDFLVPNGRKIIINCLRA